MSIQFALLLAIMAVSAFLVKADAEVLKREDENDQVVATKRAFELAARMYGNQQQGSDYGGAYGDGDGYSGGDGQEGRQGQVHYGGGNGSKSKGNYKGRKGKGGSGSNSKSSGKGGHGAKGKYKGKLGVQGMGNWNWRWRSKGGKQAGQHNGRYKWGGLGQRRKSFDCVKNLCKNEGVCCHAGGYSRCICPAGFKGNQCETDINDCAHNPCPYGAKCFDQVNGFSCIYADSNEVCPKQQTTCYKKPCKNGGTCRSYKRTYKCDCAPGYAGRNCQNNIDECKSFPCHNGGTCVDGVNKFTCKCPAGYGGTYCQTKQGQCRSDICLNGGQCAISNGIWTCICAKGYTGNRCERAVKDCSLSPCKNGGTCCEVKGGYVCKCDDGYSGKTCEKRDSDLLVAEGQGQLIFKESGNNNPKSKQFSRRCRYDEDKKCVVCGRGYELRTKSKSQVLQDLKACGFGKNVAQRIAKAAGLSGRKAKQCLKKYGLYQLSLTKRQQNRLFKRDYSRQSRYADSYLKKRCKTGFKLQKLNGFVKDFSVLVYKEGELQENTPEQKKCAKRIEQAIQSNDLKRIKELLDDKDFWIKKMKLKPEKYAFRKRACQQECKKTGKC